jgi:hypothetical protein
MVQSVALLSATLALGGCQSAGLGSNHQDIAPRWAGILFGITNACASIIGIGGIIGTGTTLQPSQASQPFGPDGIICRRVVKSTRCCSNVMMGCSLPSVLRLSSSYCSTGLLLDKTHSWTAVFGMAAAVYTAGYIGFALYGSAEQEFD